MFHVKHLENHPFDFFEWGLKILNVSRETSFFIGFTINLDLKQRAFYSY